MKKALLAAVFFFFFVFSGFAHGADAPIVSSDRAARVFLDFEFEMRDCRGAYYFQRLVGGGSSTTSGEIFFDPRNRKISYLTANGVTLVDVDGRGDTSLPGFPEVNGIARDFSMWIFCYESRQSWETLASGFFYAIVFDEEDPIVLDLKPAPKREEVAFRLPNGVSPQNLRLEIAEADGGLSRYGYYAREGKFIVYINPLFEVRYRILDAATGIVYVEDGALDPLGDIIRPEVSVLNFGRPGKIVPVVFPESGSIFFENQWLDGVILSDADGTETPAKVYYMDLAAGSLSVYTFGIRGTAEIYGWRGIDEEMITILTAAVSPSFSYLSLPQGFSKIAVVVKGEVTYRDGFYISFARGAPPIDGRG